MNDLEYYAELIEGIFGPGTAKFDRKAIYRNKVIGALNDASNYHDFRANFNARLRRLESTYRKDADALEEILNVVNKVGHRGNWQGAFAELAAFDHLNHARNVILDELISLNVTLPAQSSFASGLGGQATNVDGFARDFDLYFDVKCLKDNVTEILDGIFAELEDHLGVAHLLIVAEHDKHISYFAFQTKRNELRDELFTKVDLRTRPAVVKSEVIDDLTYRIQWERGVSVSMSSYHPFEHAELYHSTIFGYANKFIKTSRSVIVLVSFPWYNGIITNFSHSNTQFYRALARRVFCQYKHLNTPFTAVAPRFTGPESIHEVSRNISGIIFLEDNSILSTDPNQCNVRSFAYYNPNAIHPLQRGSARDYIESLDNDDFDDFEFDNY